MPLFPSYPPCASRLHDLLARAELSHDAVAQCIGLNADWVRDLQAFDHELYSNVSLAQLQRLAYLLNTDASTLLSSNATNKGNLKSLPKYVTVTNGSMSLVASPPAGCTL